MTTPTATPRLAVSGVSGFLGSHISRAAQARNGSPMPLTHDDLAAADLHVHVSTGAVLGSRLIEESRLAELVPVPQPSLADVLRACIEEAR
jgi:nucleoside-diphosphate-sugar epimerase